MGGYVSCACPHCGFVGQVLLVNILGFSFLDVKPLYLYFWIASQQFPCLFLIYLSPRLLFLPRVSEASLFVSLS